MPRLRRRTARDVVIEKKLGLEEFDKAVEVPLHNAAAFHARVVDLSVGAGRKDG